MASEFGVDPQAVQQTASELASIRDGFNGLTTTFSGMSGSTGSARIQSALDDFLKHSSDARMKLDQELERAAGMLQGLHDGATQLDGSLADAVTPTAAPSTGSTPGPAPSPTPAPVATPGPAAS